MADEVRRHQVGEVAHRGQGSVDGLALEVRCGRGSDASVSSHASAIGIEREDVRSPSARSGGYGRIERVTGSVADDAGRELVAAQHALEGGVVGDVNDAYGQRDLILPCTPGLALAVPALGDVAEQRGRRTSVPRADR